VPPSSRSIVTRLALCWLLACAAVAASAATGRIAVAGTWATGHIGLLARHGMPRERLLDPQLTDPEVLRRYDVVIVSGTVRNWDAAQPVVEQYVRDGGCALLECTALPSAEALPGQRLPAQAGPNFVLDASDHPAVAGLGSRKTYPHHGDPAAAIVPDPTSGAVVLARFTEEGANDKIRGKFVLNGQSVPAILYRPLGQGHLVYSGPWLGDALAFGAAEDDLVFALLRFFTDRNVVPRLTLAGPENLLIARAWGAPAVPAEPPSPEPTLPEGFTLLAPAAGTFQPYDVIGRIAGPVDLLLDYASPDHSYRLHLEDGELPLLSQPGDQPVPTIGPPPEVPPGAELIVARRQGTVSVLLNHRPFYETADRGQWPGAVACQGLTDAAVQPVDPVSFTDDFMQEAGEAAAWQRVAGPWAIVSTEGEARTGANPFSYGVETQDIALATAGEWFWSDYSLQASARWTQNAVGLAIDYLDANNYDLLEADAALQGLRFVKVREGKRAEGQLVPAELRPWQWYRLGVKASRGLVVCSLDGKPVLEARTDSALGPIGLYARNTKAAFDDVEVTDWRVGPGYNEQNCWRMEEGGPVAGSGASLAHRGIMRTAESWADVQVQASVRLADAQQAGVRVRDTGDAACAAVVERTSGGLALKLLQLRGAEATLLGSAPLSGRKPTDFLNLTVKAVRERVFAAVNGGPYLLRAADLPPSGAVGLFASGKGAAQFKAVDIRPADSDLHRTDPPTPAYAGVVDVMTWAGPAFSWLPDPADLDLFWHEADVPGPARLRVGVHKGKAAEAVADLVLAEKGGAADTGYVARFVHTWGAPEVSVTLSRAGQPLARGTYAGPVPDGGFLAEIERSGSTFALRVNGKPAVVHNDLDGTLDCARVGVRLQGAVLCYDDLLLERPNVRTYTFSEAPSDWLVQRGTWEVTSRWTCSPGWTWLSGLDERHAGVQSKWSVEGDVVLDTYVGAKMMNTPAGRKEVLQDIRLGICGRPGYLNAGYYFVIGAKGGAWTALQRDGLVVAETSDFVVPQGSVHNDWLRLSVSKRGNEIALLCQGQPVLRYTDPNPLPGGPVSLGAYNNGLMFPRVTVSGP
jgi:hypothetical protein